MTTVVRTHQVLVNAKLQTVFDYVSNLERHPEWSSGQLRIEALTPGPVIVGKEYISHGEVAIQKNRPNTVRVTEYEPPRRFAFVADDPDAGQVSHVFTFMEQNGAVIITRTMTLSLNPIIALLFRVFVYPFIGGPAMDRSLVLLKERLEDSSTTLL